MIGKCVVLCLSHCSNILCPKPFHLRGHASLKMNGFSVFPSKRHRSVPSHGSAFCLSPWEKIIPLCSSSHSVNMCFLWIYQLTSTRNVWAQPPNSCIDFANSSAGTFIHLIHLYPLTYSLHAAVEGYSCTANSNRHWCISMSASYSSSYCFLLRYTFSGSITL